MKEQEKGNRKGKWRQRDQGKTSNETLGINHKRRVKAGSTALVRGVMLYQTDGRGFRQFSEHIK